MIVAAIILVLCACLAAALLWSLAVYALPVWAGGFVALTVWQAGGGLFAAIVAGVAAAAVTLVVGQLALASTQSSLLRAGIGAAFAGPAAIAGYHAAHGIATALGIAGVMLDVASIPFGIVIGSAAWCGALRSRSKPRTTGNGAV